MAASYDTMRPGYESRPSANSHSSRYIPDSYAVPGLDGHRPSNDYLAPPNQLQQAQARDEQLAYQPVVPEQYQKSSRIPQGVPPAQMPFEYLGSPSQNRSDYRRRPSGDNRRASAESRHSARSHVSSRSHQSHRSDRPQHEHDREHRQSYRRSNEYDDGRDAKDLHSRELDTREHNHNHHHHKHVSEDAPLKRRNTHRPGYGGTIVAIGSWLKAAWKGV